MTTGEFWPEKNIISNEWVLNFRDTAPSGLSGFSVPVSLGEPFWTIEVSVDVPKNSQSAKFWRGFFARRKGSRNTFTANRSFNSFPASRAPVPENISVLNVDRSSSLISLGNVSSNVFSEGDMISYFTENNGYYIGEIESVSEAVGAVTLEVSPPPFVAHETTPVFRALKAIGEFRMNGPASPSETSSRLSWSFSATQVIRG